MKQTSKKGTPMGTNNNISIARNEIDILKTLNSDGENKCPYIVDYYTSYEDQSDVWLAFEKGGKCLSSLTFKIKGEFLKSERIYSIQKGLFMKYLFANINEFKGLIKKILIGIDFINSKGIIHADLKPENILVEYNEKEANEDMSQFKITQLKLIDFGSAFYATNPGAISSNTPEYLCPEVTEFLEGKTKNKKAFFDNLKYYPSCIDIWSLGITILELVLACPVWMSFKAKVVIKGKNVFETGLFGFKGRDGNKINHKQLELHSDLHRLLSKSLIYYFPAEEQELFEDLLSRMLDENYQNRITPQQALEHPFLSNV